MDTTALVVLGGSLWAWVLMVIAWRRRTRPLAAFWAAVAVALLAWVSVVLAVVVVMVWMVIAWRRRTRLLAAFWATVAVVLLCWLSPVLAVVALVGWAGVGYHRWGHGAWVVRRWGSASRRRHGVASTAAIVRHASWLAMRRSARTVRPSFRELTFWQRARLRTTECAVPLCRSGLLRVWASVEDVVLTFGAPRKGKSGWLAGRILDAPGAVLVTSTRTDLYDITHALRAARGPVGVFNPGGLGDLPSTVTFDPLSGCTDPVTASERATDLVAGASAPGGSNEGDRTQWEGQARRVLTALLHAAALGGLRMAQVQQWVANPDTAAREVLRLLRRSPSAAAYVADAEQFLTTNDRTRSSITSTIAPCLGWLASPTATAAATTSASSSLDAAGLLAGGGTVYLLGAEESQVAPLVAAFTGHIARAARRLAARAPSGRLDPPLTLALDEAALICPVPLESWTSDMGGRGVHIIAAFQSHAQLIARWGTTGARQILGNTGTVILFCQGLDTTDLTHWSALTGERDEPLTTTDPHGQISSRSTRKVPVITPAQLARLPKRRVVVLRTGLAPILGWAPMAWTRHDVRTHTRHTRRETAAVLTAAEALTRPTTGRVLTAAALTTLPARLAVVLRTALAPVPGWARMTRARRDARNQTRRDTAAVATAADALTHPTTHPTRTPPPTVTPGSLNGTRHHGHTTP